MDKRRILVVEDDITAGGQLGQYLTSLGYEIAAVLASREEAAAISAADMPDLVLFVITEAEEANTRWKDLPTSSAYVVKPYTERELRMGVELAFCNQGAAMAVREMEDRFFAGSIDLLCFLDFNGRFKRLNPAWERTLGFTREELMSKPFIEFVHPDDRERTLQQNLDVRGGGHALSFENRYLCKDGSYRWLRWNAAPDVGQQVIYSVARDVTLSKQADVERERLVLELRAALAEVNTLRDILPLCSYCRKIRDDEDYWHTVENYISEHTATRFSHSICPSCMATEVQPLLDAFDRR